MLFRSILLPVDGSDHSFKAARYAMEIASKMESSVDLLHVLPSGIALYRNLASGWISKLEMDQDILEKLVKEWKKKGKEILDVTLKRTRISNVAVSVKLKAGNPVPVILKMAKKGRYDLIVMGSRSAGGLTEPLLGSTSIQVSRYAPCPVLLIR